MNDIFIGYYMSQYRHNENQDVEQITKAERDAYHPLRRNGKARATLRWLNSTVP